MRAQLSCDLLFRKHLVSKMIIIVQHGCIASPIVAASLVIHSFPTTKATWVVAAGETSAEHFDIESGNFSSRVYRACSSTFPVVTRSCTHSDPRSTARLCGKDFELQHDPSARTARVKCRHVWSWVRCRRIRLPLNTAAAQVERDFSVTLRPQSRPESWPSTATDMTVAATPTLPLA